MSRTVNPRHHYDVQEMPHGNEMPHMQTFEDDGFGDVPLNQSIRFGATRADYDQYNNTTMHNRRAGGQDFQQYRTQFVRGGTAVGPEQFHSMSNMYEGGPYDQQVPF